MASPFSGYKPDASGMRALVNDPMVAKPCLAAAQRGAVWANQADPEGGYSAQTATVIAGWNNEPRAGAKMTATTMTRIGARDRVMVRSVNVMEQG